MASRSMQDVEDLRFRVLKLLCDQPELSQRALAERLDVSSGRLHYCLKQLMKDRLIVLMTSTRSKHRFGYLYQVTPAGTSQKTDMSVRFLSRKLAECEALQAEIAALEAELGGKPRVAPHSKQ